ncbi:MAG: Cobalamin B12-binding domain protein [Parcubacteria group bacterium GW2011_GWC1_43_12]|nr:MAG: Cobalamin B12-binding domain protein [Parcubacteria group bacterium GW2011_GWB1_42_6]KKS92301.1 MAG: Cobalamin B12-binding domain protein [Parcubacteria group bacterium GW2011_GWC1_43_12]
MKISLIVSADITDSYGFNVLAAQLKKFKDRNVEVGQFYIFYDFNKSYPPEAIEDLVSLCRGSDLIGISLLSSAFKNSVAITKALKEKINCPVIWGGKHPTADPEECVRYADMICLSEGEDALCELVERMLENKSYDDIQNLWVRKGDWIIKNPLRPVEENLDRFLPPDYSLENKFVLDKKTLRIRPIEDRDLENMRLWYPTMMTRGCPNCCTFCTNSTDLRLRKMRSRGLDNVFGEIKIFLKKYPDTKRIFFRDDCISAMPLDFIKEFCRRWKEEINLPCSCSGVIATSPDFEEKIKLLTDAGFTGLKMGIQSGCERVRRFVFARVGETDEVIMKAARILRKWAHGKNCYYMITDNPYESEEELVQSIRFTSRVPRPFSLSLYSLNFYPGTAIYNRAINGGIIKDKEQALQESTMDFKDTYLGRVFLLLRFFELPPFFVNFLTNKKIYSNKIYRKSFNLFFWFLCRSKLPTRWIRAPRLKDPDTWEIIRWIVWQGIERASRCYHRRFVK